VVISCHNLFIRYLIFCKDNANRAQTYQACLNILPRCSLSSAKLRNIFIITKTFAAFLMKKRYSACKCHIQLLSDSPFHSSSGSPIHSPSDSPIHSPSGSPIHLTTDCPIQFATDCPIQFATDYPVQFATDYPVQFATDYPVQFATDYPVQFATDYPVQLII